MAGGAIAECLENWRQASEYLARITRTFDEASLDLPSACGDWTNRELLAHIATGYAVRRGWLRTAVLGHPAGSRVAGDAANATLVAELGSASREDILQALISNRREVESLISRLAPAALNIRIERSAAASTLGVALREFSQHDLDHALELRPSPPPML